MYRSQLSINQFIGAPPSDPQTKLVVSTRLYILPTKYEAKHAVTLASAGPDINVVPGPPDVDAWAVASETGVIGDQNGTSSVGMLVVHLLDRSCSCGGTLRDAQGDPPLSPRTSATYPVVINLREDIQALI